MFFPSSTFSHAVHALFRNTKPNLASGAALLGCLAALLIWRLCESKPEALPNTTSSSSAEKTNGAVKSVMKWSYDELAHKLIIENTDLAYHEAGNGFSQSLGKSLSKVARHIDGKPVIANL